MIYFILLWISILWTIASIKVNFIDYLLKIPIFFFYFIIVGDYSKCYTYLNRTLKVIEERFGKYSLEVAFELDKISDIMVQYMDTKNDR